MPSRDKVFLLLGIFMGVFGILVTFTLSVEAGIATLLALNLLFLVMLILQRRQLGRVQQRTLTLLKSTEQPAPVRQKKKLDGNEIRKDLMVSNKRIIGLLQAQQTNLDLLNDKIERVMNSKSVE